ncbi:MAG: UDP-N-acetylmuramoyl-L-alanine--D-glutamate ligase, partial [Pseudomonadota bacterium]|nr:UDP-N-acetylmuramoyl-L-alanine--D-glutamate ligase [Pseudomonadota bacterium]
MSEPVRTLRDKTVLVLGLGTSGLAMARWCARDGANVRVWDSRAEPPQALALAEHVPAATRLAPSTLGAGELAGVDLVLLSPGLAPHDERISALLAAADAA